MICVKFNGATKPKLVLDSTQPDGSCADYSLLTYTEFSEIQDVVTTTDLTINDLFSMPIATDLEQAFNIGLYLPLLAFMVSWGYGVLINWFSNPEHER